MKFHPQAVAHLACQNTTSGVFVIHKLLGLLFNNRSYASSFEGGSPQQKKRRGNSADVEATRKQMEEMPSPSKGTTNDSNSDDTSDDDASVDGGDNKPRNTTERPSSFNRVAFDKKAKKYMPELSQQDVNNLPRFLNKLGINDTIIKLAEAISDVYEKYPGHTFPYEIALIAVTIDFLQRRVNLENPEMIKKFALFFRRTVKEFAVRYYNEDGEEFVNASLGEVDNDLYNSADPKVIMIMTAFFTKYCLTSDQNDDPINHIVNDNETMEYQTEMIFRNILQCLNDTEMSPEFVQEFVEKHFVRADVHTRGGTKGKGNHFPTFRKEVNDDKALADFCTEFQDDLELDDTIMFDQQKITHCQPILIDIIMGVLNMALYSAFLHAQDLTPHIFLASKRCEIIFQPNGDGNYAIGPILSEVATIAQGMHPNRVQRHLIQSMPEEIKKLDAGITAVLEPLNNVPIRVIQDDGEESDARFCWGPLDFFQRLYVLRMSADADIKVEDIDYNCLKEAKEKLKAMQEEHKVKKEELEVAEANLVTAKVQQKAKEATARKLKKELEDQKKQVEKAKKDKVAAEAGDLLFKHCGKKK